MSAPRTPTTPRVVRDWAVQLCLEARFETLVDDARLCVSEAVANAVTHTRTTLVIADLTLRAHDIIVSVYDDSPLPVPLPGGLYSEEERGRGLHIVEQLSAQWGTTFFGGFPVTGKAVWFRLEEGERRDACN
jgi:anti-sigma regulatory factor (Ser/Thr protein kinase)